MASKERNEEKNVKNYNYEWQTDEEIVANAHTKEFLRQGRSERHCGTDGVRRCDRRNVFTAEEKQI